MFFLSVLTSCTTKTECLYGICGGSISKSEYDAIDQSPFAAENNMTDIWSDVTPEDVYSANRDVSEFDAAIPANAFPAAQEEMLFPSQHCDQGKFVPELHAALKEAQQAQLDHRANPSVPLKIPVQFTFSFGGDLDEVGYYAYLRSILRADDDEITPVYVAPAQGWSYQSPLARHYQANHAKARRQYLRGEKCFFSTIEVAPNQIVSAPVSAVHTENIMYYGDNFAISYRSETLSDRQRRMSFAPRLFTTIDKISFTEQLNSVQHFTSINFLDPANAPLKNVIPLYVADFRQGRFPMYPAIRPEFKAAAERRLEYFSSLRSMLDLPLIHENFSCIGAQFAVPTAKDGLVFGPYDKDGITQFLRNLVYSGNQQGLMLPRQYTPLVLDLGENHIQTSSMENGTYFNLANLVTQVESCQCTNPGKFYLDRLPTDGVPHRTAWLGGSLKKAVCTNEDCSQAPFWSVEANDGFLVTLDANGNVPAGAYLFGDQRLDHDGKLYANGYLALIALGDMDCASEDPRKRLVGPWMNDLYFNKLRIWIDKNRDGKSETRELQTLPAAGVAAINACHILKEKNGHTDRFGNGTNMRSAFLYWPNRKIEAGDAAIQEEILYEFKNGVDRVGKTSTFRIVADVIFKNDETDFLRNVDKAKIRRVRDLFELFPR